MGWTGHFCYFCPKGQERIDFVVEKEGLNWEDEFHKVEVLKAVLRGARIWFVSRCTMKKTGESYVIVSLALTHYESKDGWLYVKIMDETCGPHFYDCPKNLIDLCTEPRNDWSKEWREECERKRKARKLSDLPFGTVIEVHTKDNPRLTVFRTYTGLRWYINEEKHYRMTAKHINQIGWHVVSKP